jgi:hypothetical protein
VSTEAAGAEESGVELGVDGAGVGVETDTGATIVASVELTGVETEDDVSELAGAGEIGDVGVDVADVKVGPCTVVLVASGELDVVEVEYKGSPCTAVEVEVAVVEVEITVVAEFT